ncbi:unnamed protein product [Leuciscus chuanchicus]
MSQWKRARTHEDEKVRMLQEDEDEASLIGSQLTGQPVPEPVLLCWERKALPSVAGAGLAVLVSPAGQRWRTGPSESGLSSSRHRRPQNTFFQMASCVERKRWMNEHGVERPMEIILVQVTFNLLLSVMIQADTIMAEALLCCDVFNLGRASAGLALIFVEMVYISNTFRCRKGV